MEIHSLAERCGHCRARQPHTHEMFLAKQGFTEEEWQRRKRFGIRAWGVIGCVFLIVVIFAWIESPPSQPGPCDNEHGSERVACLERQDLIKQMQDSGVVAK
jgi:hypothetical protein